MALRVVIVACLTAVSCSVMVYDPPEAGPALDAVEKALASIVDNPHLPASMMAGAKKAVASVEDTIHFLESANGKALTKEARGAKVMAAIKQLDDLQSSWQKASASTVADRKAALMKQLAEKEAELVKDKKMMKVLNLEKALAEKKLALQKLIEQKQNAAASKESEKATKEQDDMVANVLDMEKTLMTEQSTSKTGASVKMSDAVKKATANKPKLLATVSTFINGRMAILSANMKTIDEAQKKREAEIKATLGGDAAGAAKTQEEKEEMKKSQAILTMLMKKEARNGKKMRAGLQSEYNELSSAAAEIKKGDLQKLSEVMQHMQTEKKAGSKKFLY